MNKKKNVLAYISLVCFAVICGLLGFLLGTKVSNTADENGATNSNKTVVNMTKSELNNYVTKFVENFDGEYEKTSDIENSKMFWFAVRVYLTNNKISANSDGIYTLPRVELANIVDKYFGVKGFKYEVGSNDNDLAYDESNDLYTSKLDWGLSVYGEGPEYSITVVDVIDNKDGKIATLKLTYKDSESNNKEFTCILNNNYNIITFKKNSNATSTYEKINYEIKERTDLKEDDINYYELYVNNNKVLFDASSSSKYANTKMGLQVKQLKDILIITGDEVDTISVYAVDKNGSVVGQFRNYNSLYTVKANFYSNDDVKIEGNDLFLTTANLGQDFEYMACSIFEKNSNHAIIWTEKFTYLGNNKFSAPSVVKTVSAKDYINQNNIDCSK